MSEAFIWSFLLVGTFAVLNRIWLSMFLKAETSRLESRDEFAEAAATVYADSRYASTS